MALANPDLLDREAARRSLDDFARLMLNLEPARHHQYVNAKLEAVARGEIKRFMIFEPPGHGKSSYASHLFPAWFLGQHPAKSTIAVSHTAQFAARFGRKVRNLFHSPEWPFDLALAKDSKAADQWETAQGGEYFAVGVGGAVTGRRADLAIIDDPIKGREAADSETQREALWQWYLSDLKTRLKPGAAVILIQTRWHEDDLAGRILPENYDWRSGDVEARDGEVWHVVNLPALAEPNDALGRSAGEALWPDWYTAEMLEQMRLSQTPRNWSALYQQRPSPETGDFFKAEWLRYYDDPPPIETLRTYGASDYAVTEGGGDYTVHGVIGVNPDSDIYVLDWWREQAGPELWVETAINLMAQWKPLEWATETGQIDKAIGPLLRKRMHERQTYGYVKPYASTADKATRAQSIRGRMAMGKVWLPRRAPWTEALVSELLSFPSGRHDDQVDVLSLFGRMIDRMVPGREQEKAKTAEEKYRELVRQPTFNEARDAAAKARRDEW